jgi:hypothetical protein
MRVMKVMKKKERRKEEVAATARHQPQLQPHQQPATGDCCSR